MGAAKEFLGNAIQEMFVKKTADVARVLPSIKNMKIVSFHFDPTSMTEPICLRPRIMFHTERP